MSLSGRGGLRIARHARTIDPARVARHRSSHGRSKRWLEAERINEPGPKNKHRETAGICYEQKDKKYASARFRTQCEAPVGRVFLESSGGHDTHAVDCNGKKKRKKAT
jgi:hypothetical protein